MISLDDFDLLRSGHQILIEDNPIIMHVQYEVYFNDDRTICGVYARMSD